MHQDTLNDIKQACEDIEKKGHGQVSVKIKNGAVYLVETTSSKLYEKPLTINTKPCKT